MIIINDLAVLLDSIKHFLVVFVILSDLEVFVDVAVFALVPHRLLFYFYNRGRNHIWTERWRTVSL